MATKKSEFLFNFAFNRLYSFSSRKLCELFEELPDEDDYPEYYEVIEDPISLKEIKKKIDKKHYSNIDDLAEDIRLMVDNAKSFNEAESEVYQDAMEIWVRFLYYSSYFMFNFRDILFSECI